MKCRGVLFAITPGQANALLAANSDDSVVALIETVEETWDEDNLAECDYAWDAMHRCLTDGRLECGNGSDPLNHCILGPQQLHQGDSYIVSLVSDEKVREVAAALKDITEEWFRQQYRTIVPRDYAPDYGEHDLDYTWDRLRGVRELYTKAAQRGRAVIFTVDQGFLPRRRFTTVDALLDQDERSPLECNTFDDQLWLLLTNRITEPSQLDNYPQPVGVYLASRWLQWEVGNGGFAQAAYNIPQWFEMAAIGYAALGKPKAVALIKEALQMLSSERDILMRKGLLNDTTIHEVFRHFSESDMAVLDTRIPDHEWWIDEERVAYVRKNRDAFRGIK